MRHSQWFVLAENSSLAFNYTKAMLIETAEDGTRVAYCKNV